MQDGVVEEPDDDALTLAAARLVLELRHASQLAHVGDGVEDPGELGVLRHLRLHDDDRPPRVDAGGEEGVGHVERVAAQLLAVLAHGDGVQVDDAVDAVVRLLHRDPVADGAEQVAQVRARRWAGCPRRRAGGARRSPGCRGRGSRRRDSTRRRRRLTSSARALLDWRSQAAKDARLNVAREPTPRT